MDTSPTRPTRFQTLLRTATEIADDVRGGRRAAVDVVREHLARIDALDPDLNAFASVRQAGALADALAVDARPDRPELPLAGVPVAVKDNMAVHGQPVRHGSAATSERPAAEDDLLVARLRAAGAVVVGSTRMPELAAWAFTSSAASGPTRNPVDPRLDPGGSSGGAAVAVATGMAAAAVGTDGGGSIRVPAAACGVLGLKPTRDLVPLPGEVTEHWFGLTVTGPITRTAQDAATLLAVLADEPGLGACAVPGTVTVARSVRSPSPLGRPGPRQRAAVDEATSRLRAAGHVVSDAAPPYPATMLNDWGSAWLAGIAQEADRLGLDVSELEPRTRTMVRKGRRVLRRGGPGRELDRWTRRVTEWMAPYDVLLMPVTSRDPGPAGALDGKGYLHTYVASARSVPLTQAWNLAGFPAVTVPVGWRDGRPLAVQLVGRPGSEPLLLGLAARIGNDALPRQL